MKLFFTSTLCPNVFFQRLRTFNDNKDIYAFVLGLPHLFEMVDFNAYCPDAGFITPTDVL